MKFKVGDFVRPFDSTYKVTRRILRIEGETIWLTPSFELSAKAPTTTPWYEKELYLDEIYINQQDIKKLLKVKT